MNEKWLVAQGAVAFAVALGYVAYNGRKVKRSYDRAERNLQLGHHKDSLYYLAVAALLLLVLVEVTIHSLPRQPRGQLFFVHMGLVTTLLGLTVLAVWPYNGKRNHIAHGVVVRLFILCVAAVAVTGGTLLYRL